MTARAQLLALSVVGIAAVLWAKRSTAAGLSSFGVPASSGVRMFADAIATAEGFYAGNSVARRANNPGDLHNGDVGFGTIGAITVYGTEQAGWFALYDKLNDIGRGASSRYWPTMTIRNMGDVYAADGGNWSNNVAIALGSSPDAMIAQWVS